jgi:hypothetical protein
LAWKNNDEHLVVKVILELHVEFSLSSFKSSPMLSMLLSVEEVESLPISMCLRIIFTSLPLYLSFPSISSYYHQAMVPILHHIIITNFHPVFVTTSSSTVFLHFQNRTCTETPLQFEVHEIIFPTSHHTHETDYEQESCAHFTPVMQSV